MFRKTINAGFDADGSAIVVDVTSIHDGELPTTDREVPKEPVEMVHAGCGGEIVSDPDATVNEDGDDVWWDFRCEKCGEVFRDSTEWTK